MDTMTRWQRIKDGLKMMFGEIPKPFLLHEKYNIVPAFEFEGETYYMHADPTNLLAGRGLVSLVFMEELLTRCDVDYLTQYVAAMKKVVNNGQSIDVYKLVRLNLDLEERINFQAAIPDHVYKLASVVFFTKNESAFKYDFKEGMRKVEKWKATEGMYDFFLQTPLKQLIPSLSLPENNSKEFLEVLVKIHETHLANLQGILSSSQ